MSEISSARLPSGIVIAISNFTLIVIGDDAITGIKNILTEKLNNYTNCKIEYLAGSKYKIIIEALTKEIAFTSINNIYEILENNCSKYEGRLKRGDNIIQKDKQYKFIRYYIVNK